MDHKFINQSNAILNTKREYITIQAVFVYGIILHVFLEMVYLITIGFINSA